MKWSRGSRLQTGDVLRCYDLVRLWRVGIDYSEPGTESAGPIADSVGVARR